MRLAQRARYGGDGAGALAEMCLLADHPRDAFDGIDLLGDRFLQALREEEPLLRCRQRRVRFDRRAWLVGRRRNERVGPGLAQCAHELTARLLGAPPAPTVAMDDPVEAGVRHAQHVGDVVDRCQGLFVKPLGLGQDVRWNIFFGDHDALPQ